MKRKILLALIALLLVTLAISACGKESDNPETTVSTTERTTAETTAGTTNGDDDKHKPETVSVEYYNGDELIKTDSASLNSELALTYTADAPEGYSFSGWKYENGEPCGDKITLTKSIKLYADFTANTYTVTYNADGGDIAAENATVTYRESFTLAVPTRADYIFEGWFDGTTKVTDAEGKSLAEWTFLSNKELVASWLPVRNLSLTNADSAAGSIGGAGKYYEGQSVTATATPNLGYSFIGWYDGEDMVSEDMEYTFTITLSDRAYEARWEEKSEMAPFVFTSTADTCVITGLKDGDATEIYLPSFVTEIADRAFEGSAATVFVEYKGGKYRGNAENFYHTIYEITDKTVTSFELHPSTKVVGSSLFIGCIELATVSFPTGLESIGEGAFNGCTSLREITIPEGVVSIAEHAFNGCSKLESVIFPESLTTIGNFAFNGCVKLTSIELPAKLERIGVWAFQKCDALTSVDFGVTEDWVAGIVSIESADLSDTATAAKYLTTTYYSSLWRRGVQ
ncbi:MAG: leucine-rich repeat protein [Clostridia bacterium]|nr:leucine-rich repeat protein [Clostridia bacterium]